MGGYHSLLRKTGAKQATIFRRPGIRPKLNILHEDLIQQIIDGVFGLMFDPGFPAIPKDSEL
jgi:hypothetical protein